MKDNRQTESEVNEIWRRIEEKRSAIKASPCPNCKYFSGNSDLYCALNPLIACTSEATNCKDFENKETN